MENNTVKLSNEQLETVTGGGNGGSSSGLTFRGVVLDEAVMNTTIEAFCMGCNIYIPLQEADCFNTISYMTIQQFCAKFGESCAQKLLDSHR